jgi:hypothetical protein
MARRNTSVIEDVFGIAAMLPWWVGSTLAVVAYVVLHRYASADVPTNVSPGQVGQMVVGQMTKVLAFYGQFIVPLLLLAGAAASFFGRRKREGLVRDAGGDKSGATLRALNWKDFELLVGEAFRMRGFSVDDPRKPSNGTLHDFLEILVTAIAAVLSDCDTIEDIAHWGREKEDWLRQFLVLKNGVASEETFLRIFRALDPKQFEAALKLAEVVPMAASTSN